MGSNNRVSRWWRRGTATAGLSCLVSVSVAALAGTPAPADTPSFSNGTAVASAQSWKFNPTAAALSVGFTFGQSLAGYQNTGAKADARGIDLGIIGSLLAAVGCDGSAPTLPADQQPQPLQADSRDPDAAAGKSEPETFNKSPLPGITKFVRATPTPLAQAETAYAPLDAPGLVKIQGAHSSALADVVHGNTREAIATADIGAIDIGAGAVKITGLHWEAVHHSGAETKAQGMFSLGSVVIGGQAIPTSDPGAAFTAVNQALKTFGVELRAPKSHVDGGLLVVDPLAVAIVPAGTRDAVFGNAFNAVLPVRQAITDALLKASCKFGDLISILDITVGSFTGTGSFSLELGGVSATSGELNLSNLIQAIPDLSNTNLGAGPTPAVGAPADLGGGGLSRASLGSTGIAGSPGSPGRGRANVGGRQLTKPIGASSAGGRGGMLAAVAAVGFGLLVAAVEGDRRMMRRAQRMIPPEA